MSIPPRWCQLALLSCLSLPLLVQAAPMYVATPLGSLGGGSGDVRRINNSGQVAGYALTALNVRNAYVSSGGSMVSLHPPGATLSYASGINDAGVVAGTVESGGSARAVTFAGGAVTQLGSLGGAGSSAAAINNSGQVAGSGARPDGEVHAFRFTPGQGTLDLGTLGGASSMAADINHAGSVVGRSEINGGVHAFMFSGMAMSDLGTLGGNFSEANGINDGGAVVGFSYLAGDAYAHAFLYQDGAMRDLATLGGMNSFGYGINKAGVAVGSSEVAGSNALHAFLYADGVMTDLNSLVGPGLGYTLNYAADINDRGQIAALGCNQVSQCQGFLLTPDQVVEVPEPAMPALVLLGLALLALATRSSCRR